MWHLAFVVLALYGRSVFCTESRFDEYLWTKDSWSDFKLRKPRDRWRVEDAPLVYQQTQELRLRGCDFISTDGPGGQRRDVVDDDAANPDWLVALVDRVVSGVTVFGNVCVSSVEQGWQAIQRDVYEKQQLTSEKIQELLGDVCVEAVEQVLKNYKLKKEGWKDGETQWRLISREDGDELSYAEVEAIEPACERFMQLHQSEFVRTMHQAAVDFESVLKAVEKQQLLDAKGEKAELRVLEGRCEDIHPKCEMWADKGECVVNPNYMEAYCRVSCGICQGETRTSLFKKSEEMLIQLKKDLCPASVFSEMSPVQELRFHPVLRGKEITDISRALYIELKGKCLLLHRGWWSYEVCFFQRISQLHYDPDGNNALESKLIGSFGEQVTEHLRRLILPEDEMEKYGISGERRPFVLQTYENGDVCEDGLARTASVRLMCSDGLREMPWPSDSIGATIEEPDKCHYVFNVFLPLMCHYPEYSGTQSGAT